MGVPSLAVDVSRAYGERAGEVSAAGVVAVGDLERLVERGQAFAQLVRGRRTGWYDVEPVEVDERPQPALLARGGQLPHRSGVGPGRVEGHERLVGVAVAHELDGPEHPEAPHLAHRRMTSGELLELGTDHLLAHGPGVLDDAFVLEDLDRGDGAGAGQRMTRVGEASGVDPLLERLVDRVVDEHP